MPQRLPVLAICLLAVALLEIAARASGIRVVQHAAWLGVIGVILSSWTRLTLREHYLIALSIILTIMTFWRSDTPRADLAGALDSASFLMAFILLLGALNAAASTSPSMAVLGEYLTKQPPGRRYYVLNIGTGALGPLFNIGIVSLLVPLIQKGIARAGDDPLNPIRERRQISAMLRGFAWSVTWSPTAIAPLAVAAVMPGIDRTMWIVYGLMVMVPILILGAAEDRLRWRAYRPSGQRPVMAFPRSAARNFAATCFSFFALVGGIVWATGESVVLGLLLSCPIMVVAWMWAQSGTGTGARLRQTVLNDLPKSSNVAITLACSGFIGRAAAGQVPAPALAEALNLAAMPDWLLLSVLPPALAIFSLLALSPTMMAVFFGSLFAALPQMPADPTLIAYAISCGWALSMTFSPFATVVLVVDRASGIPGTRLTFGWNLVFTLLCAVVLFPVFYLLTGGL
ncbi:hypothetical protein [Tropicibacter naphthalenivorans]|uniref:Transporter, divalent anion:Na+ symporter (DASS) family n=1 Tax=Tropicibacter naphthalenivorans TaxID=441103 RepID=A0A0P1FZU5_9RHOB|nr:hypothetical protein [Tropicibacter naphthalenivorans]CUH74943.1 hypothetical protein TRN7648_00163 [Tropicibacter naphthalenivorans]SMC47912.1 hypothetical protein SAMN04488093_101715 [Tropicibacter naphthalenivorans]